MPQMHEGLRPPCNPPQKSRLDGAAFGDWLEDFYASSGGRARVAAVCAQKRRHGFGSETRALGTA